MSRAGVSVNPSNSADYQCSVDNLAQLSFFSHKRDKSGACFPSTAEKMK